VDSCARKGEKLALSTFGYAGNNGRLQVGRRNFIYASLTGIIGASVLKADIHNERNINGRFIRPPGSVPEKDFLARCIRCGECMKVCKTNGLQPALFETGLDGIWTPHLVPRRGPCEDKCFMCGQVCPTRAIRKLPLEEKLFVKMGTAVIDRSRCIAWDQKKLCLICEEICPYNAVQFKIVDNFDGQFKRPFVNAEKCTGCGWCEQNCPVAGRAAIEVYSIGEERKAHGSYITERKKKIREVMPGEEGSYNADAIGSGGETGTGPGDTIPNQTKPDSRQQPNEPLPGGFITE
jgi:MauM/NapG family ferredoxin protein